MANTQTFKTLKLDGESFYLRPWENQRGQKYGPPDRDQYELTLVNLTPKSMEEAKAAGRKPTISQAGSSKHTAGILEYYKITSQFPIKYVDSQGDPMVEGVAAGNGSKIRVYIEVREISKDYQVDNTHKFYARGVQLIKLVDMPDNPGFEPNGGMAFDKVEGGYAAEEATPQGFSEVKPEFDPILDDEVPF